VKTIDSNSVKIDTSKFVMNKSAWGAVLRSAILPGCGQFYNESYWKIPVIWGFLGYLGYEWKQNNNEYNTNLILYYNTIPNSDYNTKLKAVYQSNSNFYRDQRDLFAIYLGLAYLLNLVDAYVDAHLFDLDINKDKFTGTTQLSIKIHY
jgi:mRNA-degrading endonuclease HigB of HigAB toxin-antitoxin module